MNFMPKGVGGGFFCGLTHLIVNFHVFVDLGVLQGGAG